MTGGRRIVLHCPHEAGQKVQRCCHPLGTSVRIRHRSNGEKIATHTRLGIMANHCPSPSTTKPRRNNGSSTRSIRLWRMSCTSPSASLSLTQTLVRPRTDPTHPLPLGFSSVVLIPVSAQPTSVSGTQRQSTLHGPPPPRLRPRSICRATGKPRNVLSP